MDEPTVTMLLDVMSDEMIYEWSYELRDDTRADAQTLLDRGGVFGGSVFAVVVALITIRSQRQTGCPVRTGGHEPANIVDRGG